MHCSALLPLQCCLLSEPCICAEPVPGSGRETVHLAFWSGMGVTGFLDRARQVYVGSNRTRLHSRLRVKPGFPGRGLWSLSSANSASWSQTLAQNWKSLS